MRFTPTAVLLAFLPAILVIAAPIPDPKPASYIVKFKATADIPVERRATWLHNNLPANSAVHKRDLSTFKLAWEKSIFDGLGGTFSATDVSTLQAHHDVEYVERDTIKKTSSVITQSDAPWGLARLSSNSSLAGNNPLKLNFDYTFDTTGGLGVDIYILDSGVRITHKDFKGRATFGASFGDGVPGKDLDGHGTHVAATTAGAALGVAKAASVIAVKVMGDDGSGLDSDIISGISFVQKQAAITGRPSVINLSLGGTPSRALDTACDAAVTAGIHVVVAAGNESDDAGNSSPARVPSVITVGAVNIKDEMSQFSNFGEVVDVFAPGEAILSASIDSDTAVVRKDGTSMAAPHITGLVAYLLSTEGQKSPADLRARLVELSASGVIAGIPSDTTNSLARTTLTTA